MNANLSQLPKDLPTPVDDDAASHLERSLLPDLVLRSTDGSKVNLAHLSGRWIICVYPMTERPGITLPDGWEGIPGARGCTAQSCRFRDHYAELKALNTNASQ
jgi:peroxiredoxin